MRIQELYRQGDALYREDGHVVVRGKINTLVGVFDTTDEVYSGKPKEFLTSESDFTELTSGGGSLALALVGEMRRINPDGLNKPSELNGLIAHLNQIAGETNRKNYPEVPIENPELYAGSCGGLALITPRRTYLKTVGSTFITWMDSTGRIHVTPDGLAEHDRVMYGIIEIYNNILARELFREQAKNLKLSPAEKIAFLQKTAKDLTPEEQRQVRGLLWKPENFGGFLPGARNIAINNKDYSRGYGMFNGRPGVMDLIFSRSIPTDDIEKLAIFPGGPIPDWNREGNRPHKQVKRFWRDYENAGGEKAGLEAVFDIAEQIEEATAYKVHARHMEKTAVVIEF